MRKILIISFLSLSLLNCSSDSGGADAIEPITPIVPSVAVDDNIEAIEDEETIISDLLSNDTIENKARLTSFDANTTKGGTIEDNRDNTYTYTPPKGFIGEDSFTYTICDAEAKPNCATATVIITVTDEGSPAAVDDTFYTVTNVNITINEALKNDTAIDNSTLVSINDSGASGIIEINTDGSISYMPATNYVGDDTFTYTICDDDTPNATCSTASITVTILEAIEFNIPSELEYYYSDLGLSQNEEVNFSQLEKHTIKNHTTILSYGQRHTYLYNADADLTNSDNVILMYSGESRFWQEYSSGTNSYMPQTFNTEHIYPQSKLNSELAVTDLHHLRSTDANVNSERLNYPFIDGEGSYKLVNDDSWYPGDDWRGDIARMIFYLNVRYGETFEKVGGLDLFLEWNIADPVSEFEEQRNTVIEGAQGVRNPFIDNPYIATIIWGGAAAENKWE